MISMEAQDNHFAYGMAMARYVKLQLATTAHCNLLTPYAILRRVKPSIIHLQQFFTKASIQVPKSKRAKTMEWGQPHQQAEIGHLIGYQGLWGSTAKVPLDQNHVVHNVIRNVTHDSQSVTNPTPASAPAEGRGEGQSITECDEIEELIDGVSAMDLSEHLLR